MKIELPTFTTSRDISGGKMLKTGKVTLNTHNGSSLSTKG